MNRIIFTLAVLLLSAIAPAQSSWPQFRGADGRSTTEAEPRSLAFDVDKDVAWKVPFPTGHSSPCVWGDSIFLSGFDGRNLVIGAVSRANGKTLWRRELEPRSKRKFDHKDSAPAVPTPCTNGKRVFFYFGAYGLLATDMSGKTVWEKDLGVDEGMFGTGSSPVLHGDLVILCRDGRKKSAIYAFAEADGQERWKALRPNYIDTHATPFIWKNEKRTELVMAGSQRLTSFDPDSGEQLWQVGGLTSVICTSPTADAKTLYFAAWSTMQAEGKERLTSIFGDAFEFTAEELKNGAAVFKKIDRNGDGKIVRDELPPCRAKDSFEFCDFNNDGHISAKEIVPLLDMPKMRGQNIALAVRAGGKGDITGTHVTWKRRRGVPYVASPLLHEGRLYLAKSGGVFSCLDPATGEPHFGPERLGDNSEYYSSPVGVKGHVIVCASAGTIYVLETSDELEVVRQVELGERILATPAIVDGVIYLRSEHHLWAFGKTATRSE